MRAAAAVLLATLPRRWWGPFEEEFPLYRMAWVSGLLAMGIGIAIGVPGFINYVLEASRGANTAMVAGSTEFVVARGWALMSLPAFLFTTPAGLSSLYLTASGFLRGVGAFLADDVRGDYLLTLLDHLISTRIRKSVRRRQEQERHRREGAEAPDRLVEGARVGRPEIEWVILASRLKPDWEPNAYLVEPDGRAFQLGPPFDVATARGLRAAYPLRELKTGEAIRHSLPYSLPPVFRGQL